jgi:hypothetical protein
MTLGPQAGRIEVLDFRLAKIVEPQVEAPSSLVPTAAAGTAPITGEGRILGTVAYMSPARPFWPSWRSLSPRDRCGVLP